VTQFLVFETTSSEMWKNDIITIFMIKIELMCKIYAAKDVTEKTVSLIFSNDVIYDDAYQLGTKFFKNFG